MGRSVKIGGTWRTVSARYVRVGGVWRAVVYRYTKIAGTWRQTKIMGDMSFSGLFNASGVSPVTTSSRTLTVPTSNPGTLTFTVDPSLGSLTYSKNGGAFVALASGDQTGWANGNTLQIRKTGGGAGDSASVTIVDKTTGVTIINTNVIQTT